jgi:hypothetical protein
LHLVRESEAVVVGIKDAMEGAGPSRSCHQKPFAIESNPLRLQVDGIELHTTVTTTSFDRPTGIVLENPIIPVIDDLHR